MTQELFLSLGSNLGDRKSNIIKAYSEIEITIGPILKKSSFFENEAIGFESETKFINSCIQVQTDVEPEQVLIEIKDIEKKLGRIYSPNISGYQSRLIDIDIIFFGQCKILSKTLIIPHPNFNNRSFVLVPLLEIAKNFIDPRTQLTVKQLFKLLP